MSMKYRDLISISDEELIETYDKVASNTAVGLNYYTDEIKRRDSEQTNRIMVKCTKQITIMTYVMTIATILNIALALYGIYK